MLNLKLIKKMRIKKKNKKKHKYKIKFLTMSLIHSNNKKNKC